MHDQSTLTALKSLLLKSHPEPCMIVDKNLDLLFINEKARLLFDLQKEGPIALTLVKCLGVFLNGASLLQYLTRAFEKEHGVIKVPVFKQEKEIHLEFHHRLVREHHDPQYLLLTIVDNSSAIRLQRRMTQEEFVDRPTGLLSRKTLDVMLDLEIEKVSREKQKSHLALLIVYIKNLEYLKSLYSNEIVNLILEQIGNAIRNALRINDLLFRFDDNRILIIANTFKLSSDLLIIAERIEDQISLPFHAKDASIHLQSCIGISLFPHDGESGDTLIGNAISALNHALEEGQSWLMFNKEIHSRAMDRLFLRSGLSSAVNNKELELRYMAIVDGSGRIKGVETLIRWNHPERGMLNPDIFLPVAIHSKIIGAITRFVLFTAVEDWSNQLRDYDVFLSLNLSALDFEDNYLIESIKAAIAGKMPASSLKLEITEHECIEKIDRAIILIHQMKELGIEVLIDDFGIGNSSLTYLKELPVQWAKIDRSFVSGITGSPLEQMFLNHVIALAKLRGMNIIVEGVETKEDFETLAKTEAKYFQGHLFGSPMRLADIVTMIKEQVKK